ncbi:MAG: hypothetical protein ABEN55_23940 [Bradymonadaceae bacterium]
MTAVALSGIGCATLGIGGDTADEWDDDSVFHSWDHDDDGFLDQNNLVTNANWFDEYDEDGDGTLGTQEFREGPSEELDDVGNFRSYDEDGNGEVTDSGFYDALFADLDENDDGKLSAEEWGA